MKRGKVVFSLLFVFILIGLLSSVLAVDDLMSLQGNIKQAGIDLALGNLTVVVYDTQTGGNLIYNSSNEFNGAIIAGKYDVMLGNSSSNNLSLEYGKLYYLEIFVNNEKFSFNNSGGRQIFQSSTGQINGTYINPRQINQTHFVYSIDLSNATGFNASFLTGQVSISQLTIGSNIVLSNQSVSFSDDQNITLGARGWFKGLFNWLIAGNSSHYLSFNGSTLTFDETRLNTTIDNRIITSSAVNASWNQTYADSKYSNIIYGYNQSLNPILSNIFNQDLNTTNNVLFSDLNVTNVLRVGSTVLQADTSGTLNVTGVANFNGGWKSSGVTISGGNLFAQTIFVYNITSLAVNDLEINGSLVPDLNNTFDIGNITQVYKNVYLSGDAGDIYFGSNSVKQWLYNQTASSLYYYNQTLSPYFYNQSDGVGVGYWQTNGTAIYNATTSQVGIGTATPSELLDVNGHIIIPNAKDLRSKNTGGSKIGVIGLDSGNQVGIYDDKVNIDSSGNVGIGTTIPQTSLHINGTTGKLLNITGTLGEIYTASGARQLILTGIPIGTDNTNAVLSINPATTGDVNRKLLGMGIAGAEKFSVDVEGDVNATGLASLGSSTVSSGILVISRVGAEQGRAIEIRPNLFVSGGAKTTGYGLIFNQSFSNNVGAGVVDWTNYYDIYISNATKTVAPSDAVTNRWGLYIEPSNLAVNDYSAYFGGNVGIGTNNPVGKLNINGTGTTLNISNGTDTNLFVSSTSGRVGIGTNAPSKALHIYSVDPTLELQHPANGVLFIENDGLRKFRTVFSSTNPYTYYIDNVAGGNIFVGIRTPNPSNTLTVNGTFNATGGKDTDLGFMVGSGGNVSIGTTPSSSVKFIVAGQKNLGTNIYPFIVQDGASSTTGVGGGIGFYGAYTGTTQTLSGAIETSKINASAGTYGFDMIFRTRQHGIAAGQERMRINSTGGVGIGTITPSALLHINSSTVAGINLESGNTVLNNEINYSEINFLINDASGGGTGKIASIRGYSKSTATQFGNIGFLTSGLTTTSLIERLTIQNDGAVGIGITSPTDKLTVAGNANITQGLNVTSGLNVVTGNVGIGTTVPSNNLTVVGTFNATGGGSTTQGLLIDSSGNVGIGIANPIENVEIRGPLVFYNESKIASVNFSFDYVLSSDILVLNLDNDGSRGSALHIRNKSSTSSTSIFQLDQNGVGFFGGNIMAGSATQTIKTYNNFGSAGAGISDITDGNDVHISDDIEVDGTAYLAGGTAWTQGDIAENIETKTSRQNKFCNGDVACYKNNTKDDIDYGDLVCIDPSEGHTIMKCNKANSRLAVGVITNTSVLYVGPFSGYPVSLAGIVWTHVTNENGDVMPGDLLVTSSKPGYAMKNNEPIDGTVIGKAFDFCDKKECDIRIFVALS